MNWSNMRRITLKKRPVCKSFLFLFLSLLLTGAFTAAYGGETESELLEMISEVPDEEEEAAEEEPFQMEAGDTAFPETDVVDNPLLYMTFSSDDEDPSDGYTCSIHLENRYTGKLMVFLENAAVNNTMCATDYWGSQSWILEEGGKQDEEITWNIDSLRASRIENLESAAFRVSVQTDQDTMDGTLSCRKECSITFTKPKAVQTAVSSGEEKPQAIFADDEYTFEILSYDTDSQGQPVWNVFFENNSDKTVMIELSDVLVNGFAVDSYWNTVVAAGMKAYPVISMWSLDMSANDISDMKKVEFRLQIWKSEDDVMNFYTDPSDISCVVYPKGKDQAAEESRSPGKDDIPLIADEHFTVTVTSVYNTGENGYYGLDFYLENNTSEKVRFVADRIAYDDFETQPYWSVSLPAHSKKNASLLTDTGGVTLADLKDIGQITLEADFYNSSSRMLREDIFIIDCDTHSLIDPSTLEEETETLTEAEEAVTDTQEADTEEAAEAVTEAQEPETEAAEPETAEALPLDPDRVNEVYDDEITIRNVQSALDAAGYPCLDEKGRSDGDLGRVTLDAMHKYQEDHSLPVTDVINDDLLRSLHIVSSEVYKNVQIALKEAGYDCGSEDGRYGAKTGEAIEAYRKAEGLPEGNNVDDILLEALKLRETEEPETEEPETEEPETEEETGQLQEDGTKAYTDTDTVRNVQSVLTGLGYDCGYVGKADGKFGNSTAYAIEKYRREHEMSEGREITDDLLEALGITDAPTFKKVQEALAKDGYDVGTPDGLIGKKTLSAIDEYRRKNNLGSGERIDGELLESLGIDRQ